jgi:hypothetical protein
MEVEVKSVTRARTIQARHWRSKQAGLVSVNNNREGQHAANVSRTSKQQAGM